MSEPVKPRAAHDDDRGEFTLILRGISRAFAFEIGNNTRAGTLMWEDGKAYPFLTDSVMWEIADAQCHPAQSEPVTETQGAVGQVD